ncbi:DUF6799 domain-containing protein [Hymenobacter rubripertinctus]|uniref:DUF6799 domain-containing protein n=1 Tax=Hymenobacter rubripertinctus TaxID=2029981 RepID=UPI00362D6F14
MSHLVSAQANDGFQRLDGTVFLIRNGEVRPMPHDVQLPNGRRVTRDGWIMEADGRRTELRDGQGCSMLGEVAAVARNSSGRLQLSGGEATTAGKSEARPVAQQWPLQWRGKIKGKGKGRHKGKHRD